SPSWTYEPGISGAPTTATAEVSSAPTAAPSPVVTQAPEPTIGFTPGTEASPRVIKVTTDDNLNFTPGLIEAAIGETVKFQVNNTGKATHEFMIGQLADAFADKEGTPEVADIGPGQTVELTFTFKGTGPFAFACHAPGHFEHGMLGYIQLVGPGAPTIGTKDNPRLVWMTMDDTLKFMPDTVPVAKGETIRFVFTNTGQVIHEFQVGPAAMVDADQVDGVLNVEKDEILAGHSYSLDYTFDGSGPYAFACHEPGHYEAGM